LETGLFTGYIFASVLGFNIFGLFVYLFRIYREAGNVTVRNTERERRREREKERERERNVTVRNTERERERKKERNLDYSLVIFLLLSWVLIFSVCLRIKIDK